MVTMVTVQTWCGKEEAVDIGYKVILGHLYGVQSDFRVKPNSKLICFVSSKDKFKFLAA